MNQACVHQIMVKRNVSLIRDLIERKLGVETYLGGTDPHAGTAIQFYGPRDIDLDFLRPDVLPPRQPS